MKVGKTEVAREVNINTNSTKKFNPAPGGHRAPGLPGWPLQSGADMGTEEASVLSETEWSPSLMAIHRPGLAV